ncbi:hypothetical protein IP88_03300 [alpha proteobacterium AAP81b]|nr:hypothetical protein IP88_03300 [alpha proteobacterium AAP81b]
MAAAGRAGQHRGDFVPVKLRTAALAGILALAPVAAAAQSLPSPFISDQATLFRSDVAGVRPAPDAGEEGTRLGSLKLTASLGATAAYDSNILNLPNLADVPALAPLVAGTGLDLPLDDAVFQLDPKVSLSSDWGRHALQLSANGRIDRYANNGFNDYETWAVTARGRLDIGASTELHADAAVGRDVEARGLSGLFFLFGDPISFREDRVGLGLRTERGALRASLSGGWLQRRYDDFQLLGAAPIALDYRDIEIWSVAPQLGLRVSPGLDVFVRGNIGFTRSLRSAAQLAAVGASNRDADGYAIEAGVRGEITALVVVEIAAGWQKRDFAGQSFADYDGITYDATLDWYPTPLISLRLRSRQDFENSGIAVVPGIRLRDTSAQLYYEATRALLVSAGVAWQNRDYRGAAITTDTWEISARAEYRLNRHLSGALFVRYRDRTSNDRTILPAFSGTIVGVALETRL